MSVGTGTWNTTFSIDTPELVPLELPLAGIGSRCLALLVDYALQGAVLTLGIVALSAMARGYSSPHPAIGLAPTSTRAVRWTVAILILIPFLLHWAYFALFEALWNGRTPGKRALRIRVIHQTGRSLTFLESLIRNLIRTVDAAPFLYAVGLVSVFVTKRNQRLGDLAAGTLVIHEARQEPSSLWNGSAARSFTAATFEDAPPVSTAPLPQSGLAADELARLTQADLLAIDGFLGRRLDLPLEIRMQLAARLATQLRSRTGTAGIKLTDETFIEALEREARGAHRS
jgi:uncharacterized RDD family membrane protein YckC